MTWRYKRILRHGHRSADALGHVLEHIVIAEAALGHDLPPKAMVHHVDDDGMNNAHHNLVICQDQAYHKLLHVRARIVRMGGNPNTQKFCGRCQTLKLFEDFNRFKAHKSHGRAAYCRDCSKSKFSEWAKKKTEVAV